jgi:rhodanese-related sulfurtransferase
MRTGKEITPMTIVLALLGFFVLCVGAFLYLRRRRAMDEVTRFSVTAAELRSELNGPDPVLLLDVRHPLDLLADPHIIPGSVRIAPKEIQANPELVPKDRDVVFYCTCPSDETSRGALRKAHQISRNRVKFLRGGLAAWKALGFPVETYETAFHLDTAVSD